MLQFKVQRILVLSIIGFSFAAFAQEQRTEGRGPGGRGHGPKIQLTDAQKTCLDSKVGAPESTTEPPSKEKMDAAFAACGIEKPARPEGDGERGGRGPGPQLSEAQKQCLDAEVGAKDSGSQRPSREKMEAAMKKCGVEAPKRDSSKSSSSGDDSAQYAQLTSSYLAAVDAEVQDTRREELKALYFQTKDQNLKVQIQNFLSSHLPASFAIASEQKAESDGVSSIYSSGGGTR